MITAQQEALDWLHERFMAKREKVSTRRLDPHRASPSVDDSALIETIRRSRQGARFDALMAGDAGDDHSAADLALCNMLAPRTNWDPERIDRIFRGSGLMRPKWDERHSSDGRTYGQVTIDKAIAGCRQGYGEHAGHTGARPGGGQKQPSGLDAWDPGGPPESGPSDYGDSGDHQGHTRFSAKANSGDDGDSADRTFGRTFQKSPHTHLQYPLHALGTLQPVVQAIAEGGQLDPALVGQSVLAAAACVVQHRFNVDSLTGPIPLHIYLLTVGDSGDGKSTADRIAFTRIVKWQREKLKSWLEEIELRTAKDNSPAPREVTLITRDGTVEGIRRDFHAGRASQGCFSSEAACMVAGYGMSTDNKAKTCAVLSGMWDAGEISASRAGVGRIQLYDRRFSLHWMIQPDAAQAALDDPLLSNMGFWPRFITAWPAPSKPRHNRQFRPEKHPEIIAFWQKCADHLSHACPEECAELPVVPLADEAWDYLGAFFERMERAAKVRDGVYRDIKPFAVRATEIACRIAGVLAGFGDSDLITLTDIKNATELAEFSVKTWAEIQGGRTAAAADDHAETLLKWLRAQQKPVDERNILHVAPRVLRSKATRDAALARLAQQGLIEQGKDKFWRCIK